jgi:undecaprenyl-diphosphatase
VIISFIPTALVGLILYKFIKNVLFENQIFLVGIFAAVGGIFFLVEWLIKKDKIELKKNTDSLSYKEALIIGLAQSFAVVPGVSRAGAVIIIMILMRFRRSQAAYYSFLLSIPTIFAASFFDLVKMRAIVFAYSYNWILLTVGFLSAFISSFFVVKWFIKFLQKNTLEIFGSYRLLLAIILGLILFR